jgi:hypothetical protein
MAELSAWAVKVGSSVEATAICMVIVVLVWAILGDRPNHRR